MRALARRIRCHQSFRGAASLRCSQAPPIHDGYVRFGSKADICAAKRHVRFTPKSGHNRRIKAVPSCPRYLPRGGSTNPSGTSPSGRLTKIRTARITVVMRNAASWPFHSFDCHIAKYSPAMTMKPRNQRAKPKVNPATAQTLERLKTFAGALSRPSNIAAPSASRRVSIPPWR